MGVTGLWTVVAPTARPTKLETLNRKRVAVDASIWIYQFLKAVRDKEGNALRNSHVVGFFRRICKLLYFGIKPVFVFDGGAPVLKRETVRQRARRREGRREDAARTAGKLLAVQVARVAEEEEKKRKEERQRTPLEEEIPEDQELVYVDEIGMDQKERQAGRTFRRKDQYHLPDLDVSIESLGAPNDPRIMSQAELEDYARQFHSGEDINLYDFSKIDFESPFFLSLPAGDRYNILNAARLRSRLRMGYSKEQLDNMFPDRMAFSKFQIERVKERNDLTQRLMNINGMNEDAWNQGGRIVGEKGKEYVLVKNDGVEGGWALGVVSNKRGTQKEDAIDLEDGFEAEEDMKAESDEEDFIDVAIEGLNRLPRSMRRKGRGTEDADYDTSYEDAAAVIARKREAVYTARKRAAEEKRSQQASESIQPSTDANTDTLFVPEEDNASNEDDDLFEDVNIEALDHDGGDDDDDLQKAIAMSLEQPDTAGGFMLDASSPQPRKGEDDGDDDDEDGEMDLAAALAESRRTKYRPQTNVRQKSPSSNTKSSSLFSGPLPFESMNLGQSLLGRKKAKKVEGDISGGFERHGVSDDGNKKRKALPVPSWFEEVPRGDDSRRWDVPEREHEDDDHVTFGREDVDRREILRRQPTKQVIDLEADDFDEQLIGNGRDTTDADMNEVYEPVQDEEIENDLFVPETEADVDGNDAEQAEKDIAAKEREERYKLAEQIAAENAEKELLMEDVADQVQAEPPPPASVPNSVPNFQPEVGQSTIEEETNDSEDVDWSESDEEQQAFERLPSSERPAGGARVAEEPADEPNSDEDEAFEDVDMEATVARSPTPPTKESAIQIAEEGVPEADLVPEDAQGVEDYLSDSDEEIMRQLAIEAEEHARFASELNNTTTTAQAARDYETELKQLRNQQKKDRRDADEVTQVMVQECQALLRLFGLPYITAPMEAEAQCAELVHLGLVDGIVTDDSDIFLFGGTRIYKNMFNAAKFVECYLAADLEKEYALDRRKLIRFAHLLGSDYTEGIPGIGPVTALEIISDFGSLSEFKEWCSKVQLGRPQDIENQLTTPFRRKFKRTVQRKLFLPNAFPDLRVDHAYLQPEVDSDPAEFQWGVPDLDKLRSFLMATIGWSQDRTDEILVPVIRDINKRDQEGTQANITRFFGGAVGVGANAEGAAPRNRTGKESGRMKNAYTRLRGEAQKRRHGNSEEPEDVAGETREPAHDDETEDKTDDGADEGDDDSDFSAAKRSKQSKKRKIRSTR